MFKIGDLVEVKALNKYKINRQLIGYVETVVDGKVGVRYLNENKFGINNFGNELVVYTNPLDFLKLCDTMDERGQDE